MFQKPLKTNNKKYFIKNSKFKTFQNEPNFSNFQIHLQNFAKMQKCSMYQAVKLNLYEN